MNLFIYLFFWFCHCFLQPFGNGRLGQWCNYGIGSGRNAAFLAVRYRRMAIPAGFSFAFAGVVEADHAGFYKFIVELRMAAYAIVHHYIGAGIAGTDGLWFGAHGENC